MEGALSGNSQDTGSPWGVPGGEMLGGRDSQQAVAIWGRSDTPTSTGWGPQLSKDKP